MKLKELKKNKKGFTLVEVIVVLVILAILMAIAIPSFMGYINKAKDREKDLTARNVYLAASTVAAEYLQTHDAADVKTYVTSADGLKEISELAGVTVNTGELTVTWDESTDGKLLGVKSITYGPSGNQTTYPAAPTTTPEPTPET